MFIERNSYPRPSFEGLEEELLRCRRRERAEEASSPFIEML
jgi:hypothetical protein